MTHNTFNDYNIITDDGSGHFKIEHVPSGNTFTFEDDGTLDSPALTTKAIVNSADGQAWETLQELGYEIGDGVERMRTNVVGQTSSTSNTSFVPVESNNFQRENGLFVDWSRLSADDYRIVYYSELSTSNVVTRAYEMNQYGNIVTTFANSEQTGSQGMAVGVHSFATKPSGTKKYGLVFKSTDGNSAYIRNGNLALEEVL